MAGRRRDPSSLVGYRDNVAHNMEVTPDGKSLVLAVVDYGVWQADLRELADR